MPRVCKGCSEQVDRLVPGFIKPFDPAYSSYIKPAWLCEQCWLVIDTCDPITGAYGAASCDCKRGTFLEWAKAPEIPEWQPT
jgi:hypothetical protein